MKSALDFDGTTGAGECAGKLDEETVSGSFDLPPAVLREHLPQERRDGSLSSSSASASFFCDSAL